MSKYDIVVITWSRSTLHPSRLNQAIWRTRM